MIAGWCIISYEDVGGILSMCLGWWLFIECLVLVVLIIVVVIVIIIVVIVVIIVIFKIIFKIIVLNPNPF